MMRKYLAKICQKKKVNVTDGSDDNNSKSNSTKVTPISDMDNEEEAKKLKYKKTTWCWF